MSVPAVLLQVTRKLSALLLKALQQPDPLLKVPLLAAEALDLWLSQVAAATKAASAPRAVAAARQQLQDVQLPQHLGPAMDAATARFTAAVAALAEAMAATGSSSNTIGASTQQGTVCGLPLQHATIYAKSETCCKRLLQIFKLAGCVVSPKVSLPAVVPAAPAAVRMALTVFQAPNNLQQHEEQRLKQASGFAVSRDVHSAAIDAIVILSAACEGFDDVPSMLQLCPAAIELVQMPEFVSCLAIMAVATALGVDTSSDGRISATGTPAGSGRGSSTSRRVPGAGRQQRLTQQSGSGSDSGGAGSSGSSSGGAGAGRSGSSSVSSSDGGLSNGVRLDSLTPLSCCLFDILGVTKETAVLLSGLASSQGYAYMGQLQGLLKIYNSVMEYQVSMYVCCYV
jgi:hypothetical protein